MKTIKNILSLTSSQILALLIYLITFGYVTRFLSVSDFGLFNYWLAIIGILAKVIDFGFGPIVFRECSKDNDCNVNISTIFIYRLVILIVILILMNIYLLIFSFGTPTIFLANILLINLLFTAKSVNFRDLLYIYYKKDIKMHIPAIVNLFDSLLLLLLVLPIRFVEAKFSYFLIVYIVANIPGALFIFYKVIKEYNFELKFNFTNLKWLVRESLPLYGYVFLSYIYLQLDIFMIKYFEGESAVGLYSASVRLTRPLLIIPSAFVITFVPILVKKISSQLRIQNEISLIFKSLVFLSLVFSILFYFKANFFTVLIFGEKYLTSALPAKILFIALIFLFFNFFALDLLTIHNKQKYNLVYIIILISVGFVLNLFFIPRYSITGAAISRVISAIIGFVFLFSILRQSVGVISFINLRMLLWISVNFTIAYLLRDFNLLIYLSGVSIVMLVTIYKFKIFTQQEQNYIISAFKRKK